MSDIRVGKIEQLTTHVNRELGSIKTSVEAWQREAIAQRDQRIAELEARNEQLEAEVGLLRTPADEALAHLRKKYETSIAELEAQVDQLTAERDEAMRLNDLSLLESHREHFAHVEEVAGLKADKERLDWLEQWTPLKDECYELIRFWRSCGDRHPEGLRAAIDAARKQDA